MLGKSRAAIWLTLGILGILILPGVTSLKTLAQTQPQCTDVEIEKNIEQLSYSYYPERFIDPLVACGAKAIPALIIALKDKDPVVRSNAAYALGKIGQEAKEAVPALIIALKDENPFVRLRAASALGKIGQEAKEAVPALIIALKDKDLLVRNIAAYALGKIGQEAKEAVPALIIALKDKDPDVRAKAAEALKRINQGAN